MEARSSATVHVAMITSVCLACSEVFRRENIYRQKLPILVWNSLRAIMADPTGSLETKGPEPVRALAVGDKVVYAVTTALRRAVRPTFFRCSNLTASKTFLPTLNEQRNSISLYDI